jgi:hypothetical protein
VNGDSTRISAGLLDDEGRIVHVFGRPIRRGGVVVVVRVAGANGDSLTNQSTAGILELPRYTTVLVLGTWGDCDSMLVTGL